MLKYTYEYIFDICEEVQICKIQLIFPLLIFLPLFSILLSHPPFLMLSSSFLSFSHFFYFTQSSSLYDMLFISPAQFS